MDETEVTLQEMMACRERRAYLQRELLGRYGAPLVSFTMNIPGPVKTDKAIRKAFDIGKEELLSRLSGFEVNDLQEVHSKTGDELLLSVKADAGTLKDITTEIEEETRFGRLFDMDVMDATGEKLSRPVFRKCLICGAQAQECARSRKHSVQELQEKVREILSPLS